MESEPFKRCSCGFTYSLEEWRALARCGSIVDIEALEPSEGDAEPIQPFEMRTCRECGTTISQYVPYRGGTPYPRRRT
jgi:hypothetical protein